MKEHLDKTAMKMYTEMLIQQLKEMQESNWERPWILANKTGLPKNINGRPYSGGNILMLLMDTAMSGYTMPVYMTYRQAEAAGTYIRKGSKGFPISHVETYIKDKDGKRITQEQYDKMDKESREQCSVRKFRNYFRVFNVDQTALRETNPERYEALLKEYTQSKLELKDDQDMYRNVELDYMLKNGTWHCPIRTIPSDEAYYVKNSDSITVPLKTQFVDGESFYTTLLHEMVHSTGHEDRLDRDLSGRMGSPSYAREELVAELGASLAAIQLGIDKHIKDESKQYIKSWLDAMEESPEFLMSVIGDAGKAVNMITDRVLSQEAQEAIKNEAIESVGNFIEEKKQDEDEKRIPTVDPSTLTVSVGSVLGNRNRDKEEEEGLSTNNSAAIQQPEEGTESSQTLSNSPKDPRKGTILLSNGEELHWHYSDEYRAFDIGHHNGYHFVYELNYTANPEKDFNQNLQDLHAMLETDYARANSLFPDLAAAINRGEKTFGEAGEILQAAGYFAWHPSEEDIQANLHAFLRPELRGGLTTANLALQNKDWNVLSLDSEKATLTLDGQDDLVVGHVSVLGHSKQTDYCFAVEDVAPVRQRVRLEEMKANLERLCNEEQQKRDNGEEMYYPDSLLYHPDDIILPDLQVYAAEMGRSMGVTYSIGPRLRDGSVDYVVEVPASELGIDFDNDNSLQRKQKLRDYMTAYYREHPEVQREAEQEVDYSEATDREPVYYTRIANLKDRSAINHLDAFRQGGNLTALLDEAVASYDNGTGIDLDETWARAKNDRDETLLVENGDYALTRNGSVLTAYNLMRKVTESQVWEAIRTNGMPARPNIDIRQLAERKILEEIRKGMNGGNELVLSNGKALQWIFDVEKHNFHIGLTDGDTFRTEYQFPYALGNTLQENLDEIRQTLDTKEENRIYYAQVDSNDLGLEEDGINLESEAVRNSVFAQMTAGVEVGKVYLEDVWNNMESLLRAGEYKSEEKWVGEDAEHLVTFDADRVMFNLYRKLSGDELIRIIRSEGMPLHPSQAVHDLCVRLVRGEMQQTKGWDDRLLMPNTRQLEWKFNERDLSFSVTEQTADGPSERYHIPYDMKRSFQENLDVLNRILSERSENITPLEQPQVMDDETTLRHIASKVNAEDYHYNRAFAEAANDLLQAGFFEELPALQEAKLALYKYLSPQMQEMDPRYNRNFGDYKEWKAAIDEMDHIEALQEWCRETGMKDYFIQAAGSDGKRSGEYVEVWLNANEVSRGKDGQLRFRNLPLLEHDKAMAVKGPSAVYINYFSSRELVLENTLPLIAESYDNKEITLEQARDAIARTGYYTDSMSLGMAEGLLQKYRGQQVMVQLGEPILPELRIDSDGEGREGDKTEQENRQEEQHAESEESARLVKNPALDEYDRLKGKYPDAVLFFRCKDNYVFLQQDAGRMNEVFQLPVVQSTRFSDAQGNPVQACTIPAFRLDEFLPVMVRNGHRVAIMDMMGEKLVNDLKMIVEEIQKEGKQKDLLSFVPGYRQIQVKLGDKEIAVIHANRLIDWMVDRKDGLDNFDDIYNQVEAVRSGGNRIVERKDGEHLCLDPLNRTPSKVIDTPKSAAEIRFLTVENVYGRNYAVTGPDHLVMAEGEQIDRYPDCTEAKMHEICRRAERYFQAFEYRLYLAARDGDKAQVAKAEEKFLRACEYLRHSGSTYLDFGMENAAALQSKDIKAMGAQMRWLHSGTDSDSLYSVFVRDKSVEGSKYRAFNVAEGRTVNRTTEADAFHKDKLPHLVHNLEGWLDTGLTFQIRNEHGKVCYDFEKAIVRDFSLSKEGVMWGIDEPELSFVANTERGGVDVFVQGNNKGERPGAHISPDRWIEMASEYYPFSSKNRDFIGEFARNENLVITGERPTVALDPIHEADCLYDQVQELVHAPVSVEQVGGRPIAVTADRTILAEGEETARLIANTPENRAEIQDRAARYVDGYTSRITEAVLKGDAQALQAAVSGYLKSVQYQAPFAFDRTQATEQANAIVRTAEAARQQRMVHPVKVSVFRMSDGNFGVNITRNGVRSTTRRLTPDDAQRFFQDIKGNTGETAEQCRQALAGKYFPDEMGQKVTSAKRLDSVALTSELQERMSEVSVYRMQNGQGYAVRSKIDGEQQSAKLIGKEDIAAFFDGYKGMPKEQQMQRKMQLAAVYFRDELDRDRNQEQNRGMRR